MGSSLLSAIARRLEGKVALITGGAGGLGSVTAKLFHEHGAKVMIADIQDDQGRPICKNPSLENASFIHCDVTNESHMQNAVEKALSMHGKLDIMFNNAGIMDTIIPDIFNYNVSDFERVLHVNTIGTFLGTKHAARVMKRAQQGTIINMASTCSVIGGVGTHAYVSSKHAVLGLTRNTAVELGQYGIRVNCVSPHVFPSAMSRNALGREDDDPLDDIYSSLKGATLKPHDVARAVLYLASDEARLEGKVAVITGAARGIGESTARLFHKHGAKVVIADILVELGQKVSQDLGESATFVRCDVTKEPDIENAVNTAVALYGKLDIMFNNAAIIGTNKPNILDNDLLEFEKIINVNLIGAFLGTKHAARVMIPNGRGSIITNGSVCTTTGGVANHGYTSSKHGVVGLTKNTVVELGRHGIHVNCLSPYLVATPLSMDFFELNDQGVRDVYRNLKGVLTVEDVAEAALFLASDESKYVSGHNLMVDGGFTMMNSGFCMFGKSA
ncbi:hypothetical protein BUALT_Bualt02G0023200 [Buddleja alternifolia]|uniref:Secoisolariciresinol dehydrogenase n=1 Tax=Buddleja alternifolia TaxID=168488 RepID=A0AAV6XWP0_9LAMI|nr:hypothetical protein BUALT_Bualt02G0023200 [Buddleja alternifolia]